MRRRAFLAGVSTVLATSSRPTPAVARDTRRLKLVTSWPKGFPGLGASAERLAGLIAQISGGRLQVDVFAAGELVGAFEVFDAVSNGVADMYHSAEYYWHDKTPAFSFFAAVPFGFTAGEMNTWLLQGGGQQLWDELSADFNIKPLLSSNTGVQMGGWFVKELNSVDGYKNLRFRMPGLGGEVLRRMGAIVVLLPGGEIVPSFQSGALDGAEWVGPWNDLELGLHEVSKFYYYPGFHEPGTAYCLGVNKTFWDGLSAEDRGVIEAAAAAEYGYSIAEFSARNTAALAKLTGQYGVQVRKFDDSILRAVGQISADVLGDISTNDSITRRVYESFTRFRKSAMGWSELSQRAYLNARALNYAPDV